MVLFLETSPVHIRVKTERFEFGDIGSRAGLALMASKERIGTFLFSAQADLNI
jgi:hypothetical protein